MIFVHIENYLVVFSFKLRLHAPVYRYKGAQSLTFPGLIKGAAEPPSGCSLAALKKRHLLKDSVHDRAFYASQASKMQNCCSCINIYLQHQKVYTHE